MLPPGGFFGAWSFGVGRGRPAPGTGIASLAGSWRSRQPAEFFGGLRTINRGSAVDIVEPGSGLAVRAGQIYLPTTAEAAGRPGYLVLDRRPAGFLTATLERELGVQASYRPLRTVAVTVGAYNNKASYKAGTLPVKDALTRVDVDFGFAQGGGFYYYGTGRWLGDRTKTGVDLRTRLGPLELTGQVLHGVSYGIEQAGWYAAVSQQIAPRTTLVTRLDQNNPNLRRTLGPDTHVIVAIVHRLSPTRTVKLNVQSGLSDANPVPTEFGPGNWTVIGQLSQRF